MLVVQSIVVIVDLMAVPALLGGLTVGALTFITLKGQPPATRACLDVTMDLLLILTASLHRHRGLFQAVLVYRPHVLIMNHMQTIALI